MKLEEKLDEIHLDIIDIIGHYYFGDIATAANVAEQITERIEELIGELYEIDEDS